MVTANVNGKDLYEADFNSWLEETAKLLREGKFEGLDVENLVEEIEGMSRSEKDALESNLRVLLMHLLKWKYQVARRSNSWLYTIREHRKRIQKALEKSPSLKPYLENVFLESYQDARELAADETGLNISSFPKDCPFARAEVVNTEYLPD